jgi:prepilin-type processing-associated H-X9-DG protein
LFLGSTFNPFNAVIPDPVADNSHLVGFSSRHPGGVNFVFLDGSVRFLTDGISQEIRTAIGTIANGEVVRLDN